MIELEKVGVTFPLVFFHAHVDLVTSDYLSYVLHHELSHDEIVIITKCPTSAVAGEKEAATPTQPRTSATTRRQACCTVFAILKTAFVTLTAQFRGKKQILPALGPLPLAKALIEAMVATRAPVPALNVDVPQQTIALLATCRLWRARHVDALTNILALMQRKPQRSFFVNILILIDWHVGRRKLRRVVNACVVFKFFLKLVPHCRIGQLEE